MKIKIIRFFLKKNQSKQVTKLFLKCKAVKFLLLYYQIIITNSIIYTQLTNIKEFGAYIDRRVSKSFR